MDDELLTISEVARLYRRSEAAIRTAIWRHRRTGADLGFPEPVLVGSRYRWAKRAVAKHLEELAAGSGVDPDDGLPPRRATSVEPPRTLLAI